MRADRDAVLDRERDGRPDRRRIDPDQPHAPLALLAGETGVEEDTEAGRFDGNGVSPAPRAQDCGPQGRGGSWEILEEEGGLHGR